ncbi:MAG: hypothetical protein HQ485_00980 [Acidobacteria bacterium]|nr:hypothetical protein [Acidobacteriota bacterium]
MDVGGDGERVMRGQFQPAVPGERGHQPTRQRLDAARECLHNGGRVLPAEAHQPAGPLPMPLDGAVVDRGVALATHGPPAL